MAKAPAGYRDYVGLDRVVDQLSAAFGMGVATGRDFKRAFMTDTKRRNNGSVR